MKLFGVVDWKAEYINLYQEENEKEALDEFIRLRESGLEIGTIVLFEYDLMENEKRNLVTSINGRTVVHDKDYIELADKKPIPPPQVEEHELRRRSPLTGKLTQFEETLPEGDRCV
jgi:hypothetical protein